MRKQDLIDTVQEAKTALEKAETELAAFDMLAENNVFADRGYANSAIEDILLGRAFDDCEGSGNCGLDEYQQEFIVDGCIYVGKLTVEYNRHDKTYYYIDESEYTYFVK